MTKNYPAPRPSRVRAQYAQGVDLRPGMIINRVVWKMLSVHKNRFGRQRYDE